MTSPHMVRSDLPHGPTPTPPSTQTRGFSACAAAASLWACT